MIKEGLPFLYFKGINSLDLCLLIKSKQSYDAPARDKTLKSVPGRNGDLIIDNGRYKNIQIKYTLSILRQGNITFEDLADKIKDWLLVDNGYDVLWDSYDPRYYRIATVTSGFTLSKELKDVGEFGITFNCKPMRYAYDGQGKISLPSSGGSIYNPYSYNSAPYMKIYGSGNISVHINNQTVNIDNVDEYIEIDSETMLAHKGLISKNNDMSGDFPVFVPGENAIEFTGTVTGADIVPRWCRL